LFSLKIPFQFVFMPKIYLSLFVQILFSAFLSGQNVGIGTNAPVFKLHILGNQAGINGFLQGIIIENDNTSETGEAALTFKNKGLDGTGNKYWMVGLNQSRNMSFAYGTEFTNSNTLVVIDSTGKMGIGIASPFEKLEVFGNVKIHGELQTTLSSSNLMPYCYGSVTSAGALLVNSSSSKLISVSRVSSGVYDITLFDNFTSDGFVTLVTTTGGVSRFASTAAFNNKLRIGTYNVSGSGASNADTAFHFVIYKP
jgi:hypothetical protein